MTVIIMQVVATAGKRPWLKHEASLVQFEQRALRALVATLTDGDEIAVRGTLETTVGVPTVVNGLPTEGKSATRLVELALNEDGSVRWARPAPAAVAQACDLSAL